MTTEILACDQEGTSARNVMTKYMTPLLRNASSESGRVELFSSGTLRQVIYGVQY